ncbi:DUF935 domain-containing protein [Cognatiyoonia sp. IB215182]|uniref:DUF935 domain-containing protein n=1 Tax=Cognatiyoonia sp. IB215182 TaxID=3097353 RepID=UPI002A1776F8|nr:DUF935 domain-containing protein [Cognatiyoonia sp. IB215182]MDX8354343.1 DUF935 domain-containing protein [Cognatiyoonia sp. IB215182]
MTRKPALVDQYGRPVQRRELRKEQAAATLGGVRSPLTTYPGDGLNPVRLANILRAADRGDPVQYLELAETIEERDPHYLGVLGTRRRSVSQIDITVEAASDDPLDVTRAELVRDWLKRDELQSELFDILDTIGKGYSLTEIMWDTSEGQWQPAYLEYRDPRWFRFDRVSLKRPMMLDENGQEQELPGFKFIFANIKAKSGLPLRSGLARVATWGWMFKAFTQRDWAIFTQTYGQPLRVGKWGAGASEDDKDTLFNAVANIAGDCAAIIPESMSIDFVETSNVSASSSLYLDRAEYLDKQISKAVIGQTATTDAETGGLGSGKEHREVQEDIETADAKDLSAVINRDLVRPWMQLEFGRLQHYPRIIIARPEQEDLQRESEILVKLTAGGLRVKASQVYDRFGWEEPGPKDAIFGQNPQNPPAERQSLNARSSDEVFKHLSAIFKRVQTPRREFPGKTARQTEEALSEALSEAEDLTVLADRLADAGNPGMRAMLAQIEGMLEVASSFEEFREMLLAGFDGVDAQELEQVIADAMTAAHAGGYLSGADVSDG